MKTFMYQNDNSEFHVRNYTAVYLPQYLILDVSLHTARIHGLVMSKPQEPSHVS